MLHTLRPSSGLRRRSASANPHLLVLAWLFPPMVWGGIYRPVSFVREAASAGWRVTVVCGPEPDLFTKAGRYMLSRVPEDVRILRISPSRLEPSFRWFPRVDGGFATALETVLALCDLSVADVPDVVLASGPPFHNFIAGWMLTKGWGAKLVLDYRDEWTQCPFPFVRLGNADGKWEARCLRDADAVVFVTESVRRLHLRIFPELDAGRCHIIPNGWEPDDLSVETAPGPRGLREGPITLSFLGNLGEHSLPGELLAVVAKLVEKRPVWRERLRIRFIGQQCRIATGQLSDFPHQQMVSVEGLVPKPDALRIMRESDALLLINAPALDRSLPGKMFDYLASGSPLFVFGEGGEIGQVMRQLNAGVVVPDNDPDALERALESLRGGVFGDPKTRTKWLETHTRPYLARKMLDLLSMVVSGAPDPLDAASQLAGNR
ncbi:MAG: glycosyltransferase [Pseudomonadota bacterium]